MTPRRAGPAVYVVVDNADGARIGAPWTAEQIAADKAKGLPTPQETARRLNADAGYERFAVVRSVPLDL